jgi:hypothetical protein
VDQHVSVCTCQIDEMDRGRLTISEAMTGLRSLNIHMTDPQEEYMIRVSSFGQTFKATSSELADMLRDQIYT